MLLVQLVLMGLQVPQVVQVYQVRVDHKVPRGLQAHKEHQVILDFLAVRALQDRKDLQDLQDLWVSWETVGRQDHLEQQVAQEVLVNLVLQDLMVRQVHQVQLDQGVLQASGLIKACRVPRVVQGQQELQERQDHQDPQVNKVTGVLMDSQEPQGLSVLRAQLDILVRQDRPDP